MRLAAALLVFLPLAAVAQEETAHEYRPRITVTLPRWRGAAISLMTEQHLSMEQLAHNENQQGVGLVAPTIGPLSTSVELRQVRQTTGLIEHRWIPTLNFGVPLARGFELRERARVEIRDLAGAWSKRWQSRAILQHPVPLGHATVSPYVHYELSYDTRYAVLNRREIGGGMLVPVGAGTVVEPFVMRQTDTRRAARDLVAAGMALRVTVGGTGPRIPRRDPGEHSGTASIAPPFSAEPAQPAEASARGYGLH